MAKEDWSEAKAWMRATRERIGMTQHDAAVLANLTVDMVKKYESEKYRIQPSGRMRVFCQIFVGRFGVSFSPFERLFLGRFGFGQSCGLSVIA